MSYLYSRYLKKEKKACASCRLPAWNMGKWEDGQIVPEEELVSEEEWRPEEEPVSEWHGDEVSGSEEVPAGSNGCAAADECEEGMPGKVPVPGWEPGDLPEDGPDREMEQDQVYFRTLCPPCIRRIRDYVEEECDHLDGPGSMIYDECPDRVRLGLARDRIFDRMRQDSVPEAINQEDFAKDVAETLLYQEILARRALGKR
ncbi:MAG: hypothetical protein HFI93_01825 [Lachnospiraceae bacterium]|nr:hypothetical protein [Lachnospiraceae bacterium]